jgi:hypothetical protein
VDVHKARPSSAGLGWLGIHLAVGQLWHGRLPVHGRPCRLSVGDGLPVCWRLSVGDRLRGWTRGHGPLDAFTGPGLVRLGWVGLGVWLCHVSPTDSVPPAYRRAFLVSLFKQFGNGAEFLEWGQFIAPYGLGALQIDVAGAAGRDGFDWVAWSFL